jgi:tetratricopeptide (TPR) repeat protein
MDKQVNVYNKKEENDFYFYYLLFSTDKKYRGRKLEIKSSGFLTHTEALDLKSKVSVSILVLDPNSNIGVGCYYEHLYKGNNLFFNTRYEDAKTEYEKASECNDDQKDINLLLRKVKDAEICSEIKRNADNYFNSGKYDEALLEYDKLISYNHTDAYAIKRIDDIGSKPRTISGTVLSDGRPVQGVTIEKGFPKINKKGEVVKILGIPQMDWKNAGSTNQSGHFEISVERVCENLKFSKQEKTSTKRISYSGSVKITSETGKLDIDIKKTETEIKSSSSSDKPIVPEHTVVGKILKKLQ